MNTYFLKMVTNKSLRTDYCNQEDEHFRNLQSESFASCNGNFSYYAQIYDTSVGFMANLLGFVTFFLCFDKVEYNNSIFFGDFYIS